MQTHFAAVGHVGAVKPARAHASGSSLRVGLSLMIWMIIFSTKPNKVYHVCTISLDVKDDIQMTVE